MRPLKSLPFLIAGALGGVVLLGVLAYSSSPATVAAALSGGGLPLVAAALYRVVTLSINTMSWRALLPRAGRPRFATLLRLRWIGESVNALLPVAQIGGDFVRARLLAVSGMSGAEATAAMVADVTVSAATQVLFTMLGVAALAVGVPEGIPTGTRAGTVVVAAVLTAASAAALLTVARIGVSRIVAALPTRARSGRFGTRLTQGAAGVDRALSGVLGRRRALLSSALWHVGGWLSQVVETWLIMRLLGRPISWVAALAIESLAASARGAAFAVPGGLGVQEAALVVVAAPFGVDRAFALALGIIKRGREVVVGAPAIVAWSLAERKALGRLMGRKTMDTKRVKEIGDEAPLRVGVLVDLVWSPTAGGHVKTWERLAAAAATLEGSLDLTVHFSGASEATRVVGPNVRYRIHRPVLSTARLPFLSHIPDHTDLARYNPRLAACLPDHEVIHTTDGTFAFSRTAVRVARRRGLPLVNSIHTTTPFYTRVFTAATVERVAGRGPLGRLLLDQFDLAGRAETRMQRRLDEHLRACAFVLASRSDDRLRLSALLGPERVGLLRRGVDHALFDPRRRDRAWLEATFGIPQARDVVISVGRLDRIKNVLVLARAVQVLVARGRPIHLLCPGKGTDRQGLIEMLGDHVTCPGVLEPDTLARAYASADLCAQPAVVEELSNAVLEAGSSGLPLLVGESSGSGRFVVEGETGLVVGSAAPGDWVAALEAVLGDPERRSAMGRAARLWSLNHVPTWRQVLLEDLLPVWRRVGARARRDPEATAPLALPWEQKSGAGQ
jgi:putative membrane protein